MYTFNPWQNPKRVGTLYNLQLLLVSFLRDFKLIPVDLTNGTGPVSTCHAKHLLHRPQSNINKPSSPRNWCQRAEPHYTNTSDNLPVAVSVAISKIIDNPSIDCKQSNCSMDFVPDCLWKNKSFTNCYKHLASLSLFQPLLGHRRKCSFQNNGE